MIVVVAPNPSIDKALLIPGFRLGVIHRPERLVAVAGGKGLNVARAIHRLGGGVRACALLAGHSGRWIADQLWQEGIPVEIAWANGETRTSFSIVDPGSGQLTEVYEAGPPIDLPAWQRFEHAFELSLDEVRWATVSGSLPDGAPLDGYARLLRLAGEYGARTLVDARGEVLRSALEETPWLIKLNAAEAGEFLGQPVNSAQSAIAAAHALCQSGAGSTIITLGAEGAVAVNPSGAWYATPPAIAALAPVGSGDAFLGGLVLGLSRGLNLVEALRLAVAAGAANTLTLGTSLLERQQVDHLMGQVQVIPG
jgi:1-phosphofructokinase family hexose kinase